MSTLPDKYAQRPSMSVNVSDKEQVPVLQVGLGNISIYRQYRNTRVCNNGCRRHFTSIILLMQYIAEYCKIMQCCTIGLNTLHQQSLNFLAQLLIIQY